MFYNRTSNNLIDSFDSLLDSSYGQQNYHEISVVGDTPIISNVYKPSSTSDLSQFTDTRALSYSNHVRPRVHNDAYGDLLV